MEIDLTDNTQPEALAADHSGDATDMVGRWYMVNKMGMATLCASKADAQQEAADAQRFWPHMGPHRAVQLVDVADVEALRTGYAAARLEIESLRARSEAPDPRPVVEMCAKALAEELAAWDIDPPLHHVKEAHDACELWLAAIDADRAMRAAQPVGAQQPGAAAAVQTIPGVQWQCGPQANGFTAPQADSVTAPVGGETYHLGACIVEDMLHATVMRKEPGRAGAVTVLLSEQIPVEHLQDRDVIVNATPPAQAADSVLEDAARYRWLRATTNYVTSNGERIDVRNTPEKWDAAIDAARAAQEDKSHGRDA